MTSRDAFGGFTFAALSAKNITVVVVVMINPSLIESSTFFSNQNYSFYGHAKTTFESIPSDGHFIDVKNDEK